ncbi:hypothetical protein EC957_001852 [Mortierella hygrophila]|uniref:Uncharacterized protein n=1 Tax=Mortierella hygrophila TaxID=979708 RepID=A0A9P6F5B8_9FUNG|nr:hypothetical protein EC957_001852 [Mortierella hygrophila]
MKPVSKVPAFTTLCQLVKELNTFDYTRFCEVAVDNAERDKVIEEHWVPDATDQPGVADKTDASKGNIRRQVTRSTIRAVVHVAHLNDKLVAVYFDSVFQEAETQLTDLTSGNGEKTSADTSSQGSHSKANVKAKARAGNSNNREQRANVTEPAEDGFDPGTDAQRDTDADEDEAELTETSLYSPFCDLIKDLYRRKTAHYSHNSVALSCIINTIDGDNAAFYDKFADYKKSCVVEGFMTPTQRQLDFVE